MGVYIRGTQIVIIKAGTIGNDIAGERFEKGGAPENDILPQGDEIKHHRIIIPVYLPEVVISSVAGKRLHELMETPDSPKGFSPLHGNDLGYDLLYEFRNQTVASARKIERGTLLVVNP